MAKKSSEDIKKTIREYQDLNNYLEQEANHLRNINDLEGERAKQSEILANRQRIINELSSNSSELTNKQKKYLDELIQKQRDEISNLKAINNELDKQIKKRQRIVDISKSLIDQFKLGWVYLQQQDKIIKNTVLNLGLSGNKAELMRASFEQSASYVTRLNANLGDIQSIMEGYANETGRARVLSSEMVKDITAIGKGTGLGIEQATKLGAQFELMGFDAKSTMEYVQGVVDTSERMGVNTTKILKNINDNFKRLNTYTFQQGVKGFAQMASYAEKFKIDINQALNAADVAKSLEGAIDLTAQLQVMGGEFAKTDPFEMLFLSRNDPAKFTEKIADMTKGVVSFRKMADGSFEKFISPADRDRLAAVAKSLGMETSELTQIAERQAEIQKMRQQMAGMGLSEEQKKLIEGAAIFNKETGKFQVQLAGTMKDISSLTSSQANSFVKESKSLEERAKQAMTFDDTFKATIESLKASLLPILKQVNWLLDHTIKPIADLASKGWGVGGAAAALISAAAAWKITAGLMSKAASNWVQTGNIFKGIGGKEATGGIRGFFSKKSVSPNVSTGTPVKGAGMSALGKGIGTGAAAAGIGAGIGIAAEGISKLADSMSKLDKSQIWALPVTIVALGGAFAALIIPMTLAGTAGTAASLGLLAIGAAAVGIGFGINLATKGIGMMAEGLGNMIEKSKGAGNDMLKVAGGISAIAASMGLATLAIPGAISMSLAINSIAKHAEDLNKVGYAFENIKAVMSGSKDDFIAVQNAVESISKMNTSKGGMLAELSTLLKTPLKVEFANNSLSLNTDITLEIDGDKLMRKTLKAEHIILKTNNFKKLTGQD